MTSRGLLDADMHTVGGWVADGVRWWAAELRTLLPRRLRDGTGTRTPVVQYDASGMLHGDAADRVTVALPAGLCLMRTIERPAMGDADLARMLALDADRLMPLPGGAMLVAGKTIARDPLTNRVTIAVAGLPMDRARLLGETLARSGVQPRWIVADGIDLLPALRAAGLVAIPTGRAAPWWAAVAFLFVLNIGILIWRDVARTDALDAIVAAQQPAVQTARRIVARVDRADRVARRSRALRTREEPLALLARIGAALPPGVWIQRFTWQADGVRIAGYRPQAADVAAALRRAGGLADIRYTAADQTAAVAIGQPFELTARTAPR